MGFKKTSETIAISFGLTTSAPLTLTEDEVALQLDVLNNEIFVVLAVDLDMAAPDAIAATDTSVSASITSTALPVGSTAVATLEDSNTIAVAEKAIRAAGYVDGGVGFTRQANESYTGDIDYIALIATNNFFVQVDSSGNPGNKSVRGRMWGYRAKADSSTYAALVQSEVLSA